MKRKYPPVQDGEWVAPRHNDYRMRCCDCGLVHVMTFRIMKDTPKKGMLSVKFKATRDNRSTAAIRRNKYPMFRATTYLDAIEAPPAPSRGKGRIVKVRRDLTAGKPGKGRS